MQGGCPAQGDVRPWYALGWGLLCSSGWAGPAMVLVSRVCPLFTVLSHRAHTTNSVTTPLVLQTISIAFRLRSNHAISSAPGRA